MDIKINKAIPVPVPEDTVTVTMTVSEWNAIKYFADYCAAALDPIAAAARLRDNPTSKFQVADWDKLFR